MGSRARVPGVGTILAWLGVIGTILGILGFFISDLPALTGGKPQSLSEEDLVGTLIAFQSDKERAELQLTQIKIADDLAANQMTQEALDQQVGTSQAILSTLQAQKEEFVATQNALSGMTATAEAANAAATQAALDAGATANAVAQVTPTFTAEPTVTLAPAPVADYRGLLGANVQPTGDGRLMFLAQTLSPIPIPPPDGLDYVWLIDTDRSAATGQSVQDIGVDARLSVKSSTTSEGTTWVGTVRPVQQDGTLGEPFVFLGITVEGSNVSAVVAPLEVGLTETFDWVSRVEIGQQVFGLWPATEGHFSLAP